MRSLVRSISIGAVLALIVATGALAKPEAVEVGNLVLTHDGAISPTKLPRHRQAPISAWISAALASRDGSHLPAVSEAVIDVDDDVRVDVKGLPACKGGQLQSRDSAAARRVCRGAIVGEGSARAEIEFPEQKPIIASSPLTIFSGGVKGGTTTLFVHAFITVPVPAAVVTTVKITPIHRGPLRARGRGEDPADLGRSRLARRRQARGRPQIHLSRQEKQLPHRQLPERAPPDPGSRALR
jgi:hypothetical protein